MTIHVRHLAAILGTMLIVLAAAIWAFDDAHVAAAMAGARLSIGVGVIVAYAPVLLHLPKDAPLTTGTILSIGIIAGWVSHCLFAAYTLGIQIDFWSPNPAMVAFASTVADFAGILHLAAAKAIEGRIPIRGWIWAGIASALGAAAAVTTLIMIVGL